MMYDGIPEIDAGKPCGVCSSDHDIIHELVRLSNGDKLVQSSVCSSCKLEGWIGFDAGLPYISYYNIHSRKYIYPENKEIQGWHDVQIYFPNARCNVCGSPGEVKQGKILNAKWRLCARCVDHGWRPPTEI